MTDIEIIHKKIYTIRGQQVMLDRDLAQMYGVETRVLNQAVKRNMERFPADFMFQLTDDEMENWKSQIVISNSIKMGVRKNPYAFTELGVAMLSSVLRSDIAIQVNMGIMRAFVTIRKMLSEPKTDKFVVLEARIKKLEDYMEEILSDQNDINEETSIQINAIYKVLENLQEESKHKPERPRIGFITEEPNS